MKCPGGMIKYVDKNQWNIGCVCLCIVWKSTVNAKRLPHSLHILLFEAGSLTDWLCCLSNDPPVLASPALVLQIHATVPVFTRTLENPLACTAST